MAGTVVWSEDLIVWATGTQLAGKLLRGEMCDDMNLEQWSSVVRRMVATSGYGRLLEQRQRQQQSGDDSRESSQIQSVEGGERQGAGGCKAGQAVGESSC